MAGSLQDQLLKIGVVDKQQSKKVKHQQRKQGNKARQAVKSGKKVEPETVAVQQQLDQERHNKKSRDLELNKQRDAERTDKAIVAEVLQIIQQHSVVIPKEADVAYNFTHDKKVKKIYISSEQQKQLTLGQLAVATLDNKNTLIPDKIAEKIQARLPSSVIRIQSEVISNENDPYADYQIPDDLMW